MKISVKVLQGQEIFLDIHNNMSVQELKQNISDTLKIPISDQKLLAKGMPLLNSKTISDYPQIKDGTKLNLVVKRSMTDNAQAPASPNVTILKEATQKFLKKYFNDSQSEKVTEEFIKEFNKSIATLSLDDLERLATSYLLEEENQV